MPLRLRKLIKWDLYYALCISVWLISAAGPYLCEGCHPSLEERANLWVYLKAFELPICICRSSAQDECGLLAAGVARAPTVHRHGDQPAGGKQDQVPAVLAGVGQQEVWTIPDYHLRPADLCRLQHSYLQGFCEST